MSVSEEVKITGKSLEKFPDVIKVFALVKKAYALTNAQFGFLPQELACSIAQQCDLLAQNPSTLKVELWQSDFTLLNTRFAAYVTEKTGIGADKINLLQSIQDISQTVESIVIYRRLSILIDDVAYLQKALTEKANEFSNEIRLMRTHVMESAVGTWGQTFGALALSIDRARRHLISHRGEYKQVVLGRMLFGVAINDSNVYTKALLERLSKELGIDLEEPHSVYEPVAKSALINEMMGNEKFIYLAGDLKALAMINARIGHGFVIYGSGPRAGISEISLPAIAPGSTIMPGKINPSMAHLMFQIAEFVSVNEQMAAFAFNELDFDLTHQMGGAFITMIEMLEALGKGSRLFVDKCVKGFTVLSDNNKDHVRHSPSLANLVEAFKGQDAAQKVRQRMHSEGIGCKEACIKEGLYSEKEAGCLFDLKTMAYSGMDPEKVAFFMGLKK
ncbi:MAG TPA: hypothetical protein IAC66_01210 [Candidatus Aphodousia gallistercoris]|nr:hypothetical protein [Candidatus Aphodousia gallistercoris]